MTTALTTQHQKKIDTLFAQIEVAPSTRVSHRTRSPKSDRKKAYSSRIKEWQEILLFNPAESTVWVEPGITMDQLVRWSLPRGFIPFVVPEFKQITVGGAIIGSALESSSFRHGQFNDTCLAYEVLLPEQKRLIISPHEHADLFHGISGSYGTLGHVSAIQLPLQRCKDGVALTCRIFSSLEKAMEAMEEAKEDGSSIEYLEAIVLRPDKIVVIMGKQISQKRLLSGGKHLSFSAPWSKWYIHHILEESEYKKEWTWYLSLYDYLFRMDRGAFWMGQFITTKTLPPFFLASQRHSQSIPEILHRAFAAKTPSLTPSLALRLATGWKMSSGSLYQVLHSLPKGTFEKTFLVHDFYIPFKKLPQMMDYLTQNVQIFPLWLCPLRGTHSPQIFSPHYVAEGDTTDLINVGIYGVPKRSHAIPQMVRDLEKVVAALGGKAMLYSAHEYSEETFWSIYDRGDYASLRERYGFTELPDIIEKICISSPHEKNP